MENYKKLKLLQKHYISMLPLAHRLGLYNIKTQLDLGLKYTEPLFTDIVSKIKRPKTRMPI
jgi:GTP pyrophosphokinase